MHLRAQPGAAAAAGGVRKSGLVLLAAAVLGAVALAGAPAAHADEEPSFLANFNDATLGVDPAPGKAVPLYLSAINVRNPKLQIDTSGLRGVATMDTPKGCTASGTTITCILPSPLESEGGPPMPVVFHPAHGAAAGAKGKVAVTTSGDNVEGRTSSATITLADGVDLVMVSHAGTQQHKVGDSFSIPVSYVNAGSETAVGTTVIFHFDHGLTPEAHSNCDYLDVGHAQAVACTFPDRIEPGKGMTLVGGFHLTIASDAGKFSAVDIYVQTAGESSALAAKVRAQGRHGTGKALTLASVNRPAAASQVPPDIDKSDNYDSADIEVTDSHFDAAAVGATATGAAGSVVKVSVGVKNNGPAALDGSRPQEPPIWFVFTVPPDTSAVGVPNICAAVTDDGSSSTWGETGGTYYRCVVPTLFIGAGETTTVTFSLKILKVTTGAKGTVSLNDKFADPAVYPDDNAADNSADVIINPGDGAGGNSSGGNSSGGNSSGGGGLPVTGAATGAIAAAGVLVLVLGLVLVLLGRRRSARS